MIYQCPNQYYLYHPICVYQPNSDLAIRIILLLRTSGYYTVVLVYSFSCTISCINLNSQHVFYVVYYQHPSYHNTNSLGMLKLKMLILTITSWNMHPGNCLMSKTHIVEWEFFTGANFCCEPQNTPEEIFSLFSFLLWKVWVSWLSPSHETKPSRQQRREFRGNNANAGAK